MVKKKTVASAGGAKPAGKKKEKSVVTRGKRKESIARAVAREGKGVVRINRFKLNTLDHSYFQEIVNEPLEIAGEAITSKMDIDVNVHGGGRMSQAEAARTAIARAIVAHNGSEELKNKMFEHDRFLLREDVRRVEPKKYKGPKARARFQKSYR